MPRGTLNRRIVRIAGFAVLVALSAGAASAQSYYLRAIGASNDATAVTGKIATLVICTNVSVTDDIDVSFRNFSGTEVCQLGANDASPGSTYAFATQPIAAFPDAATCGDPGPTINQGIVLMGGFTSVVCTAMLVDPNTNPPTFMARLEIYSIP